MLSHEELTERLSKRFKNTPEMDKEDAELWVETSMQVHGFDKDDKVPSELVPLVLLHAEADGASQLSLRTAYYFSFNDKDESIDKSYVSTRYRQLADNLWSRYRRKKEEDSTGFGGARMSYMRRVDRI